MTFISLEVSAKPIFQVDGVALNLGRKRMYDLAHFLEKTLSEKRILEVTDDDQQLAATEVCKALNQVIKTDLKDS